MKIYVILSDSEDGEYTQTNVEAIYSSKDDALRHLKQAFEQAKDEYVVKGSDANWKCPEYNDGQMFLILSDMSNFNTLCFRIEEHELMTQFDKRMVSLS